MTKDEVKKELEKNMETALDIIRPNLYKAVEILVKTMPPEIEEAFEKGVMGGAMIETLTLFVLKNYFASIQQQSKDGLSEETVLKILKEADMEKLDELFSKKGKPLDSILENFKSDNAN